MDSNPASSRPNSESPIMSHSQLGGMGAGTGQTSSKSLKMGGLPMLDTTALKLQKGYSRVDYEEVYNKLCDGMEPSEWAQYKDTVGRFLTGKITRPELLAVVHPLLTKHASSSANKIRLHNQFLVLLCINTTRTEPPSSPAHFVSSSTLPTTHTYKSTPLAAELRLKLEVMALPYRDRKRIKQLPLSPPPSPPPETIAPLPNQTKPDLTPFSLTPSEFPDHEALRSRMAPILYDHGLRTTIPSDLLSFTTLASEIFVKEILNSVLSRTSKHRRPPPADLFPPPPLPSGKGAGKQPSRTIKRTFTDYAEQDEKLITMDDIRLSCSLGENLIHLLPGALARIMIGAGGRGERDYWGSTTDEIASKSGPRIHHPQAAPYPRNGTTTTTADRDVVMTEEQSDYGWEGAGVEDREELRNVLDGVLTFP